jgi:MFS family permease
MAAVTRRRLTPWMIGVGGVTLRAGLLFCYDQGVISGALPSLQNDLHVSTFESEIATSWVTLGALVGVLTAGATAARIGRRWTAVCAEALLDERDLHHLLPTGPGDPAPG